ncbi:MAG: hypothetical protein A4E19_15525 [Nitrospira sp. SG-bin1]|nr:MAG: hypothetical protein A4E19_15525 [Nitrospira sp. SG-bin1]
MMRFHGFLHRLAGILFVPTLMVLLAGVVRCSQPSSHGVHQRHAFGTHNPAQLQPVQADSDGKHHYAGQFARKSRPSSS